MIRGSKETDSSSTSDGKITKISSGPSTWLRLKDPRIVRVSRAFGGKDRHSKVCTIRGLRDRRVRLSVPTAIQLYDLQERLGLNQPSKVVDWLLNAAKHEIDELPPLPIPPGNLGLNHHQMLSSDQQVGANSQSNKQGLINWEDGLPRSNYMWSSSDSLWRGKSKEIDNEKEKQDVNEGQDSSSLVNLLPRPHNSSITGSHGLTSQTEDLHNFSVVPLPSGSQLLVCPPGTTQPLFPSHVTTTSVEIDPRQINRFQMLSSNPHNLFPNALSTPLHSISQSMRPSFHFSMTPRLLHSHNNPSDNKDHLEFPSK
ncbi:hypothetical protein LWI29_034526 [Acer saccharum]|uniref:TCP domain-containing protein n=1 Tax=Acer saccharum TaxID=4024 RepID=A0AA39S8E2_ACESA|nr:hypothetical protein LWI29_034526 [Acer saccharum]KAK1555955.1 hypothetical protein Q3G72_033846 [Acer saccharum]